MLAALRGVFDLRCGGRTLLERLHDARAEQLCLIGRTGLHDLWRAQHPVASIGHAALAGAAGECRFVNARWLALGGDLERVFASIPGDFLLQDAELPIAARCSGAAALALASQLESVCNSAPDASGGARSEIPVRQRSPRDDLW